MTTYETIYHGGDSGLSPGNQSIYQPISYKMGASDIGTTLDGRTANQLNDVGNKLASGAKVLEVQGVQAGVLESMPKQHMKEIGRQFKLAGATPTLHGPVLEFSGITQQGFDEGNRIKSERQLTSALMRGHDLDPDGNVSVTTHTTAGLPEMEEMTKVKEKVDGKMKEVEKLGNIFHVDPRTGSWSAIKAQKRFFPEQGEFKEGGKEFDVKQELGRANKDSWVQSLTGINRYTEYGENTLDQLYKERTQTGIQPKSQEEIDNINNSIAETKRIGTQGLSGVEKREIEEQERQYNHGVAYFKDAYQNMKGMFDIAYESAAKDPEKNKQDIKLLKEFAREAAPIAQEGVENDPEKLNKFKDMIESGLRTLGKIQTPTTIIPLKDFVIDKSTQSFANAATEAYKKFGDKAPILNIENPPAGGGLSRAEDLIKVIEESRKKMAQNLVDDGASKGEAKKAAEKSIGATWDVGHINMLRGKGYSEKDIIKETEKIAPFVKHVHLSDNFGYEHTELPMGMGNVPMKEIMKRLGEKGFKGKKIVEAFSWFEHFQDAPGQPPKGGGHALAQTMQAFDSPIFTTGTGYSWAQMPGLGAYAPGVGQGAVSPPVSQSMYGTAFSTLPAELGGQMGGDQSRFSGTPNQ